MADFKKNAKKKRVGLGVPPPPTETKGNLETPEVFEEPVTQKGKMGRPKSNRTVPLTTTLTPDFRAKLKKISYEENRNIGQIIEEAVNFWMKNK